MKSLAQAVRENPYPDYAAWWPMGVEFNQFMAEAMVSEWSALPHNAGDLGPVKQYVTDYIGLVYQHRPAADLVAQYVERSGGLPIQSGQFDALSYAFFRAAFELIAAYPQAYQNEPVGERRLFTKRVGSRFFAAVKDHLALKLPGQLTSEADFDQLRQAVQAVGQFLQTQGYLRDHFAFRFAVDLDYQGGQIRQPETAFITNLNQTGLAYALYEMGYPAILPSAVYLYQTMGEAQHHSSRTIEELFQLVGYQARETDDFDPTGFPSDRVVELWEIRPPS